MSNLKPQLLEDVEVYIRRHAAPGEDPSEHLHWWTPDAPEDLADDSTPVCNRPFRLVSKRTHPLVLDVHEDGEVQIYGLLCFKYMPYEMPDGLGIASYFLGQTEVTCRTNPSKITNTFFQVKAHILFESDPLPRPNASDPHGAVILPFVIYCNPSPFPVTFKSPAAQINYGLVFRFRATADTIVSQFEHMVPVVVVPPWAAAPPPEPPALKQGDAGVSVVVDVDGSVHGSVHKFAAVPWLRPRGLHDGSRVRPSLLKIGGGGRSSGGNASGSVVSGSSRPTDPVPRLSDLYNSSEIPSWLHLPPPPPPPALSRTKSLRVMGSSEGGVRMRRSKSFGSRQLIKLSKSRESLFVPVVMERPSSDFPLPYTVEDPLAGQVPLQPPQNSNWAHSDILLHSEGVSDQSSEGIPDSSIDSVQSSVPQSPADLGTKEGKAWFDASRFLTRILSISSQQPYQAQNLDSGSISASKYEPKKDQSESSSSEKPVYTFDFLLASTISGPNAQIPIAITFTDSKFDEVYDEIEIELVADICSGPTDNLQHDVVSLEILLVPIDTKIFKKTVVFRIPDSEKLGCYAVGFKMPFLQLSHKMKFRLFSRSKGLLWGRETEVEMGSIGMTLLR